jgi:hypothetical protein
VEMGVVYLYLLVPIPFSLWWPTIICLALSGLLAFLVFAPKRLSSSRGSRVRSYLPEMKSKSRRASLSEGVEEGPALRRYQTNFNAN